MLPSSFLRPIMHVAFCWSFACHSLINIAQLNHQNSFNFLLIVMFVYHNISSTKYTKKVLDCRMQQTNNAKRGKLLQKSLTNSLLWLYKCPTQKRAIVSSSLSFNFPKIQKKDTHIIFIYSGYGCNK